MWADFLADGDGPVEVIGQDGTLSQFYCETCDKDLKSEELKKQHFSEHIACAFPGCKFEAHFLVSFGFDFYTVVLRKDIIFGTIIFEPNERLFFIFEPLLSDKCNNTVVVIPLSLTLSLKFHFRILCNSIFCVKLI